MSGIYDTYLWEYILKKPIMDISNDTARKMFIEVLAVTLTGVGKFDVRD